MLERAFAGRVQKLDGAWLAKFCKRPAVGRKGALGSIPETEQRFATALRLRALQPHFDLTGAHRPLAILTRRAAKRAVIASAAAKIGEWQECFRRKRHRPPEVAIANGRSGGKQLDRWHLRLGKCQRVLVGERRISRVGERATPGA